MMKKIALAVVLSTTALSAIAEESKDFYAQVNAGYAWGMKSTASKNDFDTESSTKLKTGKSFSIGLEGGAQVNEYLRAGLSFDYMPSFKLDTAPMNFSGNTPVPASFSTSTTPATPAAGTYYGDYYTTTSANPKIKSMNLMANLFIDAGNFSGFKPYAVVGLGMSRNKAGNFDGTKTYKQTTGYKVITAGTKPNDALTKDEQSGKFSFSGKTKNNFAFKLGLGFKYAVNEDFDVDVRYQYLNLGKAKWDVNGESATVKLTANQLMLGVAYKF